MGFDEEMRKSGLISKLSGDGGKEGLGSIRKREGRGVENDRGNGQHRCANQ